MMEEELRIPELYVDLIEHFKDMKPLLGKGTICKKIQGYDVVINADGDSEWNSHKIKQMYFYLFSGEKLAAAVSQAGGWFPDKNEEELLKKFKVK